MTLSEVRDRLGAAGHDTAQVVWGDEAGPEHRWTVLETSAGLLVGGRDHGRFVALGTYADAADAADALGGVLADPEPERLGRTAEQTAQAAALAVGLMDGLDTGEPLPSSGIRIGTPLEHVGNASGHVLHPYGTPAAGRALDPAHAEEPVTGYLLVHSLPLECRAERTPAGHGQPGGAWRIVLDRPVAHYVATGGLRPFVPAP